MNTDIYETKKYVEHYHKTPGNRIKNILENIKVEKKDLIGDFACGNGLLPKALNQNYQEYNGVDKSSLFIKECKEWVKENKIKNTYFFKGDIVKFCKQNPNKYTKSFTLDFSEHIDDKEFIKIYTAIKGAMKDKGQLIIHTPNKDFILERIKDIGILRQTSGHIGIRNFNEYKLLLKKCGYKNIKVKYLPHYRRILNILPTSKKARLLITCTK